MQVVKNIIPAIASTNALISAACVNECIKLMSGFAPRLDNYMQYMGQTGVGTTTYVAAREPDCLICAFCSAKKVVKKTDTLQSSIDKLKAEHGLKNPSLDSDLGTLFLPNMPMYVSSLEKSFEQL
jgi:NEDD8-activating enzyme E1